MLTGTCATYMHGNIYFWYTDLHIEIHAHSNHIMLTHLVLWRQIPGITDLGLVPRRINKVAILGGGLMGSGIATALIMSNIPVILKEVNEKFLEAGIGRVKGISFPFFFIFLVEMKILAFRDGNGAGRVRV